MPTDLPRRYGKNCPVTGGFDSFGHTHIIFCGLWTCPLCQKTLARKWAIRAKKQLWSGENGRLTTYWFLTLTLGGAYHTAQEGFKAIPKLWNTTRMQFQRKCSEGWEYLAFVEGQPERGHMPHFHVLTSDPPPAPLGKRGQITQHNLHNWAYAIGWGYQIKLEPIRGAKAASYVAKYATKQSPVTPKGFRRVRASQGWYKEPENDLYALKVPFKGEDIAHFIDRISEETGVPHEELFKAWSELWHSIGVIRNDHKLRRIETPRAAPDDG
jgi:hypothetical protein